MEHLTWLHLGRFKASLVNNTQACQEQTLAYFAWASMAKRKEKKFDNTDYRFNKEHSTQAYCNIAG